MARNTQPRSRGGVINLLTALHHSKRRVAQSASAHAGVIYLLDACQSVGQMPVDVQAIGCHFLTATGRKFLRAPRGSGFLYASEPALADSRLEPAAVDVRGARWTAADTYVPEASARRYEEYEMSFAAKVHPRSNACSLHSAMRRASKMDTDRCDARFLHSALLGVACII